MSKDIRSYFTSANKKKTSDDTSSVAKNKPRKHAVIRLSDDEDESSSPTKNKSKDASKVKSKSNADKSQSKKRAMVIDSDEDEDEVKCIGGLNKKPKVSDKANGSEKLTEVNVKDVFTKKPLNRVNAPKVQKKQTGGKPELVELEDDFDKTLEQLDMSNIEEEYIGALKDNKSPNFKDKSKKEEKESASSSSKSKVKTPEKHDKGKNDKIKSRGQQPHPKLEIERESKPHKPAAAAASKEKSEKKVDFNEMIEEKIDKKKQHAMQYQHYLNRGGARNPGSKEVPKAEPDCLANMSFLITGVLDSLEREEIEGIIKQYGGKVTHSVSKKLSYMIVGDEPGPSKMTKAESLQIKMISEDGFLDLLRNSSSKTRNDAADSSNKRKREASVGRKSPDPKKNKHETAVKDKTKSPEKKKDKHESPVKERPKSPAKKHASPKKSDSSVKTAPTKESKKEEEEVKPQAKKDEPKQSPPKTNGLPPIADASNDGVDHLTALVEKYRPKDMKQIIGQTGDRSNAKKLHFWLKNWHNNHGKNAKAKPKYNPRDDTGIMYKAALLSGPPGIGKTTTAYVVCAELGFEVIEFNASDTRSKKLLQAEIAGILKNRTVKSFLNATEVQHAPPKHVLLMDEVDGMAGNEDRGGMQELIAFIKSTEIPIICICNDRQSQKIKTLANYTFDLRFQKPRLELIRAAMMSICFKEGIKVTPDELTRIIQSTNQDIRQVINHVAVLSAKSRTSEENSRELDKYKNLRLGPWEVIRKVFSADEHKNMSIHDKSDLFFHDYNIAPLFVEENYPIVNPNGSRNDIYDKLAKCSESLAIGDVVEKSIRNGQNWSLLPVQACFSSVIPGSVMSGFIGGQINFPSWLGKNSKTNKCDRLLQDITVHARVITGASKEAINLDYLKMLAHSIVRPLAVEGTEGVDKAVEIMNKYHLTRDDLDSLLELTKWPNTRDLMQSVDTKTKTAFTKAYNKSASYNTAGTMKKSKGSKGGEANDEMLLGEEDDEQGAGDESDNEEDEKIENDKLIKAKTSTSKKASAPAASTSRGGRGGKKPAAGDRNAKKK